MNTSIEDRLRSYAATLDAATDAKSAGRDENVIETLPAPTALRPQRDRRLLSAAAAIALLLIAGAAVVVSRQHDDGGRVATNPSVTTQPTIHFTPVPTTPPTTAHQPSAADDLAPFFTGATSVDQKLKAAATRVNADMGPNGLANADQTTVDAIAAADPTALAKTIPGGMPSQLEAAVLVVWSELESRHASLCVTGSVDPSNSSGCYTNGAAAAARFPADLAKAKTLAASLPPIPSVGPDSHAAGEVAVQINAIVEANAGCGGTGGSILTGPQPVVWKSSVLNGVTFQGTIGGTPFQAHYDPATGWFARLNVC